MLGDLVAWGISETIADGLKQVKLACEGSLVLGAASKVSGLDLPLATLPCVHGQTEFGMRSANWTDSGKLAANANLATLCAFGSHCGEAATLRECKG